MWLACPQAGNQERDTAGHFRQGLAAKQVHRLHRATDFLAKNSRGGVGTV
ncbi:hypothetical protein MPNT_80014 [Candidatus Methylacidithermus pantelleriae]|uniref:Uncharacterized protein n=1 Tax=Candidatus Methylacidithermus pantelleriae TaxID=2744239 RepID=A0A8J2BNE1_9BACT|nr:hypothetical protein MPNT_80014 [Candidatus Methylacidithermus pantelleriae]